MVDPGWANPNLSPVRLESISRDWPPYECLMNVLNATACLISCISKYDHGLSARRTALAQHPSASAVQACRDCPPVSPESSTDVPHRLLRSSVR